MAASSPSVLSSLSVLAGPDALEELRDHGLRPERVRALVGASGGPKWLVLRGLDEALFPWLLAGARAPVHAVASSIGTWRHACLCASDPRAAIERFAHAYVEEQRYRAKPTPADVSAEGARILSALLGPEGTAPLLSHPTVRLHVVTARFRHIGAREGRSQKVALGLAALLNAASRRALSLAVERVVFDAEGDPGPFAPWRDLSTVHVPLTEQNVLAALSASTAIPAVMAGVRDPHGAPPGVYRDGGVADYHFGAEIDPPDGLTLYPHFYSRLVPGWFDKALPWRRTTALRRTVVLAPSRAFVQGLPGGRIPDRTDFARLGDRERVVAWRSVLDASRRLGEAFLELAARPSLAEVAGRLAEPGLRRTSKGG